jgi:hypothetical protein
MSRSPKQPALLALLSAAALATACSSSSSVADAGVHADAHDAAHRDAQSDAELDADDEASDAAIPPADGPVPCGDASCDPDEFCIYGECDPGKPPPATNQFSTCSKTPTCESIGCVQGNGSRSGHTVSSCGGCECE